MYWKVMDNLFKVFSRVFFASRQESAWYVAKSHFVKYSRYPFQQFLEYDT